ncbi:hypothetical protein [Rhodococcus sp. HS-D2]|uniref:hypothetical protein n=1 Tax=Rhodococcus sp. HS-D2 TaxID=1384636 RepID=UPI000B1409A0
MSLSRWRTGSGWGPGCENEYGMGRENKGSPVIGHREHLGHDHTHTDGCGHIAVPHGDHVDYIHDGHRHAAHDDHYDDH